MVENSEKITWHKHHLIPHHAGGTNDPSNIVKVNIPLHAMLHKILFEEYGRWQDNVAWLGLSGQIGKEEATLMAQSAPKSEATKQKMRKPKSAAHIANMRAPKSEEHKRKCAEGARLRPVTEKQLAALRANSLKNRIQNQSPEYRAKMSIINKAAWAKRKLVSNG